LAASVAVLSSAAFIAALWLIAAHADDGDVVLLLTGPPATGLWLAGTIVAARRAGGLRVDTRL